MRTDVGAHPDWATVMATNEGDQGTGDDEGTRGPAKGTGGISLLIGTRGDQRDRRWLR